MSNNVGARERRRYTDAELRELGFRLGIDRAQVRQRGHDWDIADIMAVFTAWQNERDKGTSHDRPASRAP